MHIHLDTHANVDVVKLLGLGRLPVVFCQVVRILHHSRPCLLSCHCRAAALCSEMAEIVQKVALVGSIDFGSSWLLFWE